MGKTERGEEEGGGASLPYLGEVGRTEAVVKDAPGTLLSFVLSLCPITRDWFWESPSANHRGWAEILNQVFLSSLSSWL